MGLQILEVHEFVGCAPAWDRIVNIGVVGATRRTAVVEEGSTDYLTADSSDIQISSIALVVMGIAVVYLAIARSSIDYEAIAIGC